jgi:A/G-specific adenine glycosylase
MKPFAQRVIEWQRRSGRHELPWQNTRDPYRVWLSEIMLQQTQVTTVIAYYQRFVERFPTIATLAEGTEDEVLQLWSGLGYYSRGRNLHRAAQVIARRFNGVFPREIEAIESLPGVGRSTAAAIGAFAFGDRHAILDGNVKRVLARYLGVEGYPGETRVQAKLWERAEVLLPADNVEAYTQGLMDLGATLCLRSKPRCPSCPIQANCYARRHGRVDELPTRRAAKPLPHRHTVMLLLAYAGEVLLEKRPPTGIWGGLWSFPEAAPGEDVTQFCRDRLGLEVRPEQPWAVLDHGFTHYKLSITPQPAAVLGRLSKVEEFGRLWVDLDIAGRAAVPKPVKTLLGLLARKKAT